MTSNKQPTLIPKSLVIGIVVFLSIFNYVLFCEDVYLIKDPTPTVVEDKPVFLEEVEKIDMDLGNDQYLFTPKSLAADETDLFVYDSSQARVYRFSSNLKLIGSFGREGQGPGEFFGKKKRVELSIGQDGNVYANDIYGYKIMGYSKDGRYLKTFKYGTTPHTYKPVCDKRGNILYVTMKDDTIEIKTDLGFLLAQHKSEKLHRSFLFKIPSKEYRERRCSGPLLPFTNWKLTKDSKFLILFQNSSVLSIFNGKKYVKTIKLWPQNALPSYAKKDRERRNRKTIPGYQRIGSFGPMFENLIVDQDNLNIFYLKFCGDYSPKETGTVLYSFNLEGKLLNVIHIPTSPGNEDSYGKFVRVQAKVNNTFYAIRGGEEVVLYKEKEDEV